MGVFLYESAGSMVLGSSAVVDLCVQRGKGGIDAEASFYGGDVRRMWETPVR
jgi:hypothetical protein